MKKIILTSSFLLLAGLSFAQTSTQPPAALVAFQQQETAKRQAFYQQMKQDRDAFLASHPEVQAYLQQLREESKERLQAWLAQHPKRLATTTTQP